MSNNALAVQLPRVLGARDVALLWGNRTYGGKIHARELFLIQIVTSLIYNTSIYFNTLQFAFQDVHLTA